jgi:hypothetical protein
MCVKSTEKMSKALTRRTDIWSWAASVLEMFLGERIWFDGTLAGLACEDYFDMVRIPLSEGFATASWKTNPNVRTISV